MSVRHKVPNAKAARLEALKAARQRHGGLTPGFADFLDRLNDAASPKMWTPAMVEAEGGPSYQYQARMRMAGAFCRFTKIGRRVLYRREDLARWYANHMRRNMRSRTAPAEANIG